MSLKGPPAATLIAQSSSLDTPDIMVVDVDERGPKPSLMEIVMGEEGSARRFVSWWTTAMVVATTVRVACFEPAIFGNYLMKNLGPLERERVGWSFILAVRAYDLALGGWIWTNIDGLARRDGALFGALIAMVSRLSLYSFEHSYFLLSTPTIATLLLTDVVSLGSAFSLLPTLLPHPPTAHPSATGWRRISKDPVLLWNIALATGWATFVSSLASYVVERAGGMEWIKQRVFELTVPSYLSQETLTPLEMLANPTISIPIVRSFLTPLSMPTHLAASFLLTLLSIPLVTILPTLSSHHLALLAFSIIAPSSSLLLWDVFPISFVGAAGAGIFMGLRGAVVTGLVAWVLEELREIEVVVAEGTVVLVDEKEGVVAVAEVEVVDEEAVEQLVIESEGGAKHVRL
ncbi:hypothetical protein RQP46_010110 [Phenoliferia psychrophenolica]